MNLNVDLRKKNKQTNIKQNQTEINPIKTNQSNKNYKRNKQKKQNTLTHTYKHTHTYTHTHTHTHSPTTKNGVVALAEETLLKGSLFEIDRILSVLNDTNLQENCITDVWIGRDR